MCGRYTLTKPPAEFDSKDLGSTSLTGVEWKPRFNIAPTQDCLVVTKESPQSNTRLTPMRWGLIPSWSKEGVHGSLIINARAETADAKPSFRDAYQRRRCLVPADGFYEWKRSNKAAQPYYFQMRDSAIFYMAGLWEQWAPPTDAAQIHSFTILTVQANDLLAQYHHRMPVILKGSAKTAWLEGDPRLNDSEKRFQLLKPYPANLMASRPVSHRVNNNRNDDPSCLDAPDTPPSEQLDLGI